MTDKKTFMDRVKETGEEMVENHDNTTTRSKKREPDRKSFLELDGYLYLSVISEDGEAHFAHMNDGEVKFSDSVTDEKGHMWHPQVLPTHSGEPVFVVGVPRTESLSTALLCTAEELLNDIMSHLERYIDVPMLDIQVTTYFILFTWFYAKVNTTPYLRFIADTGKGKTRILRVVSDLCFYPVTAAGSSTASGVFRFNEKWHGTLRMDEADLDYREDGPQNDLIKYLNLGFERGQYFLMTDKNDLKRQEVFDPFCPKTIAMRQPFRDNATEGRCLSFSPYETKRTDIPILLPDSYDTEVDQLRAKIARFVLENWSTLDGSKMMDCRNLKVEPRVKQLSMPLSIVLQLVPDGEKRFREYLINRQKELRKTRAESFDGALFNYVYSLAIGDESPGEDFAMYLDDAGTVKRVTAGMIANTFKVTSTTVTRALKGIGFQSGHERLTYAIGEGTKEQDTRSRTIRPLIIPDEKTWTEIVQRYYYDENGKDEPQCPEPLRGSRWIQGTLDAVPDVPDVPLTEDT